MIDARQAYAEGRGELLAGGKINEANRRRMVWLAMGLCAFRQLGAPSIDFSDCPDWQHLRIWEQKALEVCWRYLGPPERDTFVGFDIPHLADAFIRFEEGLSALEAEIGRLPTLEPGFLQTPQVRDGTALEPAWTNVGGQLFPWIGVCMILRRACRDDATFGHLRRRLPNEIGYQIDISDIDIGWMLRHSTPAFWHVFAPKFSDIDHGARLDLLDWVIRQPDCDRATAAAIFLLCDGPRILVDPDHRDPAILVALCSEIAARAQDGWFKAQTFALDHLSAEELDSLPKPGTPGYPERLFRDLDGEQGAQTPFYQLNEDTLALGFL